MAKTEPHVISRCRCGGEAAPKWANDYIRRITWHKIRCIRCGAETEPRETIWQAYADWEAMAADESPMQTGMPEQKRRMQEDVQGVGRIRGVEV